MHVGELALTDVRSAHLGHYATTSGGPNKILCAAPIGNTLLVKSILVWNTAAAAAGAYAAVLSADQTFYTYFLEQPAIEANGTFEWNGWIVLGPAQCLYVSSQTAGVHFWASGTKLTGWVNIAPLLQGEPRPQPADPTTNL